MAKHFDRKISGAISGLLLKTPVTPNQITLSVTLLGIGAGVCMAQPGYRWKLLGALVFLATSILDGCDGEIARAKKLTSRLGDGWIYGEIMSCIWLCSMVWGWVFIRIPG